MIKILNYGEVKNEEIFSRAQGISDVSAQVAEIIKTVAEKGDEALFDYSLKFDKVKLDSLVVTKKEIDDAVAAVPAEFLEILKKAAENVKKFHSAQVRKCAGGDMEYNGNFMNIVMPIPEDAYKLTVTAHKEGYSSSKKVIYLTASGQRPSAPEVTAEEPLRIKHNAEGIS